MASPTTRTARSKTTGKEWFGVILLLIGLWAGGSWGYHRIKDWRYTTHCNRQFHDADATLTKLGKASDLSFSSYIGTDFDSHFADWTNDSILLAQQVAESPSCFGSSQSYKHGGYYTASEIGAIGLAQATELHCVHDTHQTCYAPHSLLPPATPPVNSAGMQCNDGTSSFAEHTQGACSHHGGLSHTINREPYPDFVLPALESQSVSGSSVSTTTTSVPPIVRSVLVKPCGAIDGVNCTFFQPWTEPGSGFPTRTPDIFGSCTNASSIVSYRADAWQCSTGQLTLDPCFVNIEATKAACYKVNELTSQEKCPDHVLSISAAPPEAAANKDVAVTKPWELLVDESVGGDDYCLRLSGTPTSDTSTVTYKCQHGYEVVGEIDQSSSIWTVRMRKISTGVISTHKLFAMMF